MAKKCNYRIRKIAGARPFAVFRSDGQQMDAFRERLEAAGYMRDLYAEQREAAALAKVAPAWAADATAMIAAHSGALKPTEITALRAAARNADLAEEAEEEAGRSRDAAALGRARTQAARGERDAGEDLALALNAIANDADRPEQLRADARKLAERVQTGKVQKAEAGTPFDFTTFAKLEVVPTGDQRIVDGYASSEALDGQDEIVDAGAIEKALTDFMQWANLREMHENKAAGVVIRAEVAPGIVKTERGDIMRPLHITAEVVDLDAWNKVKKGVYKGFSIGGKVLNWVYEKVEGRVEQVKRITELVLTEISLVDRPANPDARILVFKRDLSAEQREALRLAASPDVISTSVLPPAAPEVPAATIAKAAGIEAEGDEAKVKGVKDFYALTDDHPFTNDPNFREVVQTLINSDAARATKQGEPLVLTLKRLTDNRVEARFKRESDDKASGVPMVLSLAIMPGEKDEPEAEAAPAAEAPKERPVDEEAPPTEEAKAAHPATLRKGQIGVWTDEIGDRVTFDEPAAVRTFLADNSLSKSRPVTALLQRMTDDIKAGEYRRLMFTRMRGGVQVDLTDGKGVVQATERIGAPAKAARAELRKSDDDPFMSDPVMADEAGWNWSPQYDRKNGTESYTRSYSDTNLHGSVRPLPDGKYEAILFLGNSVAARQQFDTTLEAVKWCDTESAKHSPAKSARPAGLRKVGGFDFPALPAHNSSYARALEEAKKRVTGYYGRTAEGTVFILSDPTRGLIVSNASYTAEDDPRIVATIEATGKGKYKETRNPNTPANLFARAARPRFHKAIGPSSRRSLRKALVSSADDVRRVLQQAGLDPRGDDLVEFVTKAAQAVKDNFGADGKPVHVNVIAVDRNNARLVLTVGDETVADTPASLGYVRGHNQQTYSREVYGRTGYGTERRPEFPGSRPAPRPLAAGAISTTRKSTKPAHAAGRKIMPTLTVANILAKVADPKQIAEVVTHLQTMRDQAELAGATQDASLISQALALVLQLRNTQPAPTATPAVEDTPLDTNMAISTAPLMGAAALAEAKAALAETLKKAAGETVTVAEGDMVLPDDSTTLHTVIRALAQLLADNGDSVAANLVACYQDGGSEDGSEAGEGEEPEGEPGEEAEPGEDEPDEEDALTDAVTTGTGETPAEMEAEVNSRTTARGAKAPMRKGSYPPVNVQMDARGNLVLTDQDGTTANAKRGNDANEILEDLTPRQIAALKNGEAVTAIFISPDYFDETSPYNDKSPDRFRGDVVVNPHAVQETLPILPIDFEYAGEKWRVTPKDNRAGHRRLSAKNPAWILLKDALFTVPDEFEVEQLTGKPIPLDKLREMLRQSALGWNPDKPPTAKPSPRDFEMQPAGGAADETVEAGAKAPMRKDALRDALGVSAEDQQVLDEIEALVKQYGKVLTDDERSGLLYAIARSDALTGYNALYDISNRIPDDPAGQAAKELLGSWDYQGNQSEVLERVSASRLSTSVLEKVSLSALVGASKTYADLSDAAKTCLDVVLAGDPMDACDPDGLTEVAAFFSALPLDPEVDKELADSVASASGQIAAFLDASGGEAEALAESAAPEGEAEPAAEGEGEGEKPEEESPAPEEEPKKEKKAARADVQKEARSEYPSTRFAFPAVMAWYVNAVVDGDGPYLYLDPLPRGSRKKQAVMGKDNIERALAGVPEDEKSKIYSGASVRTTNIDPANVTPWKGEASEYSFAARPHFRKAGSYTGVSKPTVEAVKPDSAVRSDGKEIEATVTAPPVPLAGSAVAAIKLPTRAIEGFTVIVTGTGRAIVYDKNGSALFETEAQPDDETAFDAAKAWIDAKKDGTGQNVAAVARNRPGARPHSDKSPLPYTDGRGEKAARPTMRKGDFPPVTVKMDRKGNLMLTNADGALSLIVGQGAEDVLANDLTTEERDELERGWPITTTNITPEYWGDEAGEGQADEAGPTAAELGLAAKPQARKSARPAPRPQAPADIAKTVVGELAPALAKLGSDIAALAGNTQKADAAIAGVSATLQELASRVEAIESTPMPGGPALRDMYKAGHLTPADKSLPGQNGRRVPDQKTGDVSEAEIADLRRMAATEPNQALRQDAIRKLNEALAARGMRA